MASKKQGNLFEYCRVAPHVAALGEPPLQRDRLGILRNNDADRHLAGPLIVRSIKGDSARRIAAKAQFALFSSHFRGCQPSFIEISHIGSDPLPDNTSAIACYPSRAVNNFMKFRFAL
jgi:hypothetical protein